MIGEEGRDMMWRKRCTDKSSGEVFTFVRLRDEEKMGV